MNNQDKRQRSLGEARRIIDDVCSDAGCPGLGDAISLEYVNSVGGCVVALKRQTMACEGTRPVDIYCDMYGLGGARVEEGGRLMIEQEAVRMCRAHLRTKAIGGQPGADDPHWSHDIHPLSLAMLRYFGLTDREICQVEGSFMMRTPSMQSKIIQGRLEDTLRIEQATNNSGRISTLLRVSAKGGTTISIDTMGREARIIIGGADAPETARLTLVGATVDRLIGHPAFEGTDIVVTEVGDDAQGRMSARIMRRHDPLGPAPFGADLDWMGLEV